MTALSEKLKTCPVRAPEVTTRLGMRQPCTEQCSEFGIKPSAAGSAPVRQAGGADNKKAGGNATRPKKRCGIQRGGRIPAARFLWIEDLFEKFLLGCLLGNVHLLGEILVGCLEAALGQLADRFGRLDGDVEDFLI